MGKEKIRVRSARPAYWQRIGVCKIMRFGQGALWMPVICGLLPAVTQPQEAANLSVSTSIQVSQEALATRPVAANWLSYNGDYTGRRFSILDQITVKNVDQLRAQWVFHVSNSNSMEVTPVVFEGLMFVTSANDAFALDAQTGRMIWHYSRPVTEGLIDAL